MLGKQLAVVLIGIAFTTLVSVGVGAAQDTPITIQGRVEWISGQVMVIAPDGMAIAPAGTSAINIDLSQVDQDEYAGLTAGDRVLVIGTVPRARNRVNATSIQR